MSNLHPTQVCEGPKRAWHRAGIWCLICTGIINIMWLLDFIWYSGRGPVSSGASRDFWEHALGTSIRGPIQPLYRLTNKWLQLWWNCRHKCVLLGPVVALPLGHHVPIPLMDQMFGCDVAPDLPTRWQHTVHENPSIYIAALSFYLWAVTTGFMKSFVPCDTPSSVLAIATWRVAL